VADQQQPFAFAVGVGQVGEHPGGGLVDRRLQALVDVADRAQHPLQRLPRAPRRRAQHPVGHQRLFLQPAPGRLGLGQALGRQRAVDVGAVRRGGLGVGMAQEDEFFHAWYRKVGMRTPPERYRASLPRPPQHRVSGRAAVRAGGPAVRGRGAFNA